jgi:hypothetical protein
MRHSLTAIAMLAACGSDPLPHVDPDAATGCRVDFTGNFVETAWADANCPHLDSGMLTVAIASATLHGDDMVMIALGTAAPGHYASATVASWSAFAFQHVGTGGCELAAGSTSVPSGSFTLDLADATAPHGMLHVVQYVLTVPGTDCGDGETESVDLQF